jgi:hypothetical protein
MLSKQQIHLPYFAHSNEMQKPRRRINRTTIKACSGWDSAHKVVQGIPSIPAEPEVTNGVIQLASSPVYKYK